MSSSFRANFHADVFHTQIAAIADAEDPEACARQVKEIKRKLLCIIGLKAEDPGNMAEIRAFAQGLLLPLPEEKTISNVRAQ